jgi:hypothetical protein
MAMDLTGIDNINEYYTNHYFSDIFESNAEETLSAWREKAKTGLQDSFKTPWSRLRSCIRQYYQAHELAQRSRSENRIAESITSLAHAYLDALDFPTNSIENRQIVDDINIPIYLAINKPNGAPLLWVMLARNTADADDDILDGICFSSVNTEVETDPESIETSIPNEDLATKILFALDEPPRWLLFIGLHQIALIDRNKWNEKRYLSFDLEDIFSRREESTLQAMSVLLHYNSLCPKEGASLLDKLDENSHRHAAGVSKDLKYALRECIELLGNAVLDDMVNNQKRNMDTDPVDAAELSLQCMRYMYRMLFIFFI